MEYIVNEHRLLRLSVLSTIYVNFRMFCKRKPNLYRYIVTINHEKFTKDVFKSGKSTDCTMTKRKKQNKRTNNNLQNTTQKTKDQATRTSLKAGVNSCVPKG